jgi:hypothetical protein
MESASITPSVGSDPIDDHTFRSFPPVSTEKSFCERNFLLDKRRDCDTVVDESGLKWLNETETKATLERSGGELVVFSIFEGRRKRHMACFAATIQPGSMKRDG